MKKITNPYAHVNEHNKIKCFGCSKDNPDGLQLDFNDLGDEVESFWEPKPQFEGFNHVLHGGIQATLIDEIGAWFVFAKCGTSCVTQNMNIHYLKPVYTNKGALRLTARLIEQKDKTVLIDAKLMNLEGDIRAQAEVEYFIFPEAIAKRKYGYPGVEAFYGEES